MKHVVLPIAIALMTTSLAHADSPDTKGCWDGRDSYGNQCLVKAGHKWSDKKITVTYKNRCGDRIYAKVCQGKTDGTKDCGAFAIKPHTNYKYYTYNATGKITFNAVGSKKPSNDWVCSSKYNLSAR